MVCGAHQSHGEAGALSPTPEGGSWHLLTSKLKCGKVKALGQKRGHLKAQTIHQITGLEFGEGAMLEDHSHYLFKVSIQRETMAFFTIRVFKPTILAISDTSHFDDSTHASLYAEADI